MLKFDRLKTVSPIDIVKDLDFKFFDNIEYNNRILRWEFDSTDDKHFDLDLLPFKLYIKLDWVKKELVLDIPAKLLYKDYPKLISFDTAELLIANLNSLGIISVNFSDWYEKSKIIACDITKDEKFDFSSIIGNSLSNLIKNPSKWEMLPEYDNGYEFVNKNLTKNRRFNFKIYNKNREMYAPRNLRLEGLNDDTCQLIEKFNGVTRFELELRSYHLLRKYLKVSDRRLSTIMESSSDPIKMVVEEVFDLKGQTSSLDFSIALEEMNIDQLKDYCLLEKCEFDSIILHGLLKKVCSKNTKIPKVLERFRGIIKKIDRQSENLETETISYLEMLCA